MIAARLTAALPMAGRLALLACGGVATVVIAATLALADLLAAMRARFTEAGSQASSFTPLASNAASVVILNWNGKHLLERGLPSVLDSIRDEDEVVMVDNGSTDDSVAFVREAFSSVRIVELPRNMYFSAGNNAGILAAKKDIVVLLNNDMIVDRNFLEPLTEALIDSRAFAATAQIFLQDPARPRHETGLTSAEFKRGTLHLAHRPSQGADAAGPEPVLWAGGGSSAYDARKLRALGGLDELYAPAYVEDVALSYAAWKRGWPSVYVASSHVYHEHRATSRRKFGDAHVDLLISRNRLLFTWRHFGWRLLADHLAWLPAHFVWLASQHSLGGGFSILFSTLARLPRVALGRAGETAPRVLGDRQILEQAASAAAYETFEAGDAQPAAVRLGAGWHSKTDASEDFRWTGRRAATFVELARVPSRIRVRGRVPELLLSGRDHVRLRISISGAQACVRDFKAAGAFVATVAVTSGPLGWRRLVLETNRTFIPAQRGDSRDGRELGIQVYGIDFD